jgi:hypothetical protein
MEVLFEKKPRSALRRTIARIVAVLPIQQRRSLRFFAVHRRFPRIRNPRTFNEMINWRVLRDRRPELAWTCDKLAAKRRVSEVCPSVRIPETYWHGTDLAELATVDLPDEWVLKPNGGCGLVLMGDGSVDATRIAELVQLTDGWLDQDLAGSTGEWAYSQCERCLFVEEKVGLVTRPHLPSTSRPACSTGKFIGGAWSNGTEPNGASPTSPLNGNRLVSPIQASPTVTRVLGEAKRTLLHLFYVPSLDLSIKHVRLVIDQVLVVTG